MGFQSTSFKNLLEESISLSSFVVVDSFVDKLLLVTSSIFLIRSVSKSSILFIHLSSFSLIIRSNSPLSLWMMMASYLLASLISDIRCDFTLLSSFAILLIRSLFMVDFHSSKIYISTLLSITWRVGCIPLPISSNFSEIYSSTIANSCLSLSTSFVSWIVIFLSNYLVICALTVKICSSSFLFSFIRDYKSSEKFVSVVML